MPKVRRSSTIVTCVFDSPPHYDQPFSKSEILRGSKPCTRSSRREGVAVHKEIRRATESEYRQQQEAQSIEKQRWAEQHDRVIEYLGDWLTAD